MGLGREGARVTPVDGCRERESENDKEIKTYKGLVSTERRIAGSGTVGLDAAGKVGKSPGGGGSGVISGGGAIDRNGGRKGGQVHDRIGGDRSGRGAMRSGAPAECCPRPTPE